MSNSHNHNCSENACHSGHCHNHSSYRSPWITPAISFILLIAGLLFTHFKVQFFLSETIRLIWYLIAFLPVGFPVIKEAVEEIRNKDFFNEFTLMVIACVGAFFIKEYPEAVGVMLFYSVGELLQEKAVSKATRNITSMLDMKTVTAHVLRDNKIIDISPDEVLPGEIIEIRPGERVPLDGELLTTEAIFDTTALTGESLPRHISEGQEVLSGMVATNTSVRIKTSRHYSDSTVSRILHLVQDASERKASTVLFIRKFARIYTPSVTILAILLVIVPWIVSLIAPNFHYNFDQWLYRGLVFLVISCPCALVISVPLSYFAGIGAASRAGILFKGGNFLEAIARINTVAFDKTGTLTSGQFNVDKIETAGMADEELLSFMASAEIKSSHPLAKAITNHVQSKGINFAEPETVEEIAGHGVITIVNGHKLAVGNIRLLRQEKIDYPKKLNFAPDTLIVAGIDGKYAGYVSLNDTLKPQSAEALRQLSDLGVSHSVMLSGDKKEIVADLAEKLRISEAYGELLPEDKANFVSHLASSPDTHIAFVGDGMNDAPVLALSNVGIAMGGLGSDAAIESADVVIQDDNPCKVATAIRIGRTTRRIVRQNIIGAIAIKILILVLGATGEASLWAAVFADVGVALLTVINSMRIMWKKY